MKSGGGFLCHGGGFLSHGVVVAGYRVGIEWPKNGHPQSMHKVTKFHAPDFYGGTLGHEHPP